MPAPLKLLPSTACFLFSLLPRLAPCAPQIGPARGCAYASLSMQLKAGLASLPVLASPEGVGVLPLPTFNSDCSDATGLKFTLTWDMTNTGTGLIGGGGALLCVMLPTAALHLAGVLGVVRHDVQGLHCMACLPLALQPRAGRFCQALRRSGRLRLCAAGQAF